MTVNLRSRQRPDSGAPKLGRSVTRIGEESSTLTESSRRDDGAKPDGATVEGQTSRLGKRLRLGTWNVRTIDSGKIDVIENEMERMSINNERRLTRNPKESPSSRNRRNHGKEVSPTNSV